MCPVLVLLLLLVPVGSESTSTTSDNTGLTFVVAFPENIAYFHPSKSKNRVIITAVYDNTDVSIKSSERNPDLKTLNAGETYEYQPDSDLELSKVGITSRTLQITSSRSITVHVINLKRNSVQTALVTAADKLGTKYLVPPLPAINGTTHPADAVTSAVTEKGPFRLIIINTDQTNVVTVQGAAPQNVSLQPHQVAQIWVHQEDKLRAVEAEQPVAVLFGHTCAIRYNCTCAQLFATLSPASEEEQMFYIPPALAKGAEGEAFVLISEKESTSVKPFSPDSPLVKTSGSAVLYRPGLLLTLIPDTDFAACFVANYVPDAKNVAVIVVNKDKTDGVHLGSQRLDSPEWQQLEGTEFVSTTLALTSTKNVIWHADSKMAVYFAGKKNGALFANPAAIISKSPDFRGCVVSPEVVEIGEVAGGWRESLKHCRDKELDLVSFPGAQLRKHISKIVQDKKSPSLKEAWFAMRRNSQTGEWYWLSRDPVSDTNWAPGEPGTVQDGQCAIMSVESSKNFEWSDEDCCKEAYPICYKGPVLLPL